MPLSARPSSCLRETTRGAVVDTTDRGAGLATNDKALVTTADILKLVSAVDTTNADESTLSAVSSVLVVMNKTVTDQIAKKRSSVDKGDVDGEALTKKQKRLKKQLGEHVSPSANASKTGLGVFHTPVGKRNAVPALPDAPEKGVIRIGRTFQADVSSFEPMQTIDDRGDKLVIDPTGRDKLPKTHAACGTPGCIFRDHHLGPHSDEASLSSRRICPPAKNINDIGLHTYERQPRGAAQTAAAESLKSDYDSVSKKAHRFRIAMQMTEVLHSDEYEGVVPRLFLIGAPDKKDVLHLTKMVPRSIDIVSLNRSTMDSPLSFQNVAFEECTEALDYLSDAPTGSFTHIWLDLTERECDMKLLFAARRALAGLKRAQLFITLSTRGVTAEDCSTIITTQLAALGGHVSHYENYRGVDQKGFSSAKRNMVFLAVVFNEAGHKRAMLAGYDSSFNPIGAMAWIAVEEKHDNVAVYTFRSGKKHVHTHFGMVTGYTGGVYTVRLFSDRGALTNTLQVATPSQLHKVSCWNPKELRAFRRHP